MVGRKNDRNRVAETQDSLPKLADNLVSGTKSLLREVKTEEDLKIGFEKLLDR